jgi:hypothetical protein
MAQDWTMELIRRVSQNTSSSRRSAAAQPALMYGSAQKARTLGASVLF